MAPAPSTEPAFDIAAFLKSGAKTAPTVDAAAPTARDAALSAMAIAVGKGDAAWDLGQAKAFLAAIGSAPADDAYKAAKGVEPRSNGWPCTAHNGRMVCLEHASRNSDGSYSFNKANLDAGR